MKPPEDIDLKQTLLLVDDDSAFLNALARSMSRLGYLVWPVSTVAEACRTVQSIKPDFAVVDLRLKEGNGLDVVTYIGSQSPQTKTVMLSGYANVRSAVAAVRAGAVDCIAKPVNADELHTALISARSGHAQLPKHSMHPDEARMQHILARWAKNDLNTTQTADELGLHRRSLQRLLRRAGLRGDTAKGLKTSRIMSRFPALSRFWSDVWSESRV